MFVLFEVLHDGMFNGIHFVPSLGELVKLGQIQHVVRGL